MKEIIPNTWQIIREKAKDKYWLVPFCIIVLCVIDTIASLFNTGFVKVDALFIVLLIAKMGVLIYNLYILWNLFIQGKTWHYQIFKTYTGYAVIFIYVFYSLPRLSWEIQGLITGTDSLRLWIFTLVSAFFVFCLYWILRFSRTQLAWGIVTEEELRERKTKKKKKDKKKRKKEKKTVKEHIIENVHVVIQAIITVIIIQHFTFQLYEIPTESMVPTFLIKDRVFVTKFQYGPTIPLTSWHLPSLVTLKRGNIVVFESPEYKQENVVKRIFHQFIFYLTLSRVNIDKDEFGDIRKQLIVKRLVGMPGEKLQMIDDVVYVKREGDSSFKVLEEDKKYANVNLHEIDRANELIKAIPMSDERRKLLDKWDEWKRIVSPGSLTSQLILQTDNLEKKLSDINPAEAAEEFKKILQILNNDYANEIVRVKNYHKRKLIDLFTDIGTVQGQFIPSNGDKNKIINHRDGIWGFDHLLFQTLLEEPGYIKPLLEFLRSTTKMDDLHKLSSFQLNARKLNIKMKLVLAERLNQYLDLILNEIPVNDARNILLDNISNSEAGELFAYIQTDYDNRNFPEFPAGDENFLASDEYYLMGDNRYNSLDFRFSHKEEYSRNHPFRPLDPTDSHSVMYQSIIEPYSLKKDKILGTGKVRIWPFNRIGVF